MKTFIALLIACCVLSCKDATGSKNDHKTTEIGQNESKTEIAYNQLIVPASHLGSIKLLEESKAVYDSLGTPDAGDAAMQKAVSTWYFDNPKAILTLFTAIHDQNSMQHKIYLIRSTSPDFKTEDGVGVNSSLDEVKSHFSIEKQGTFTENGQVYTLYETKEGIGFEFDKSQKCSGVIVHESDAKANQTYLPIYADFHFTENVQ